MSHDQRKTITVDEAAIALGISRNHAYEAVKQGDLPALKIGRRILIPKAAFERLLAEADGAPAGQAS